MMTESQAEMSHELLAHASRMLARTWNQRLNDLGITYAGYIALSVIADDPASQQASLAQALHVRIPTLGSVLDRLERQGHLVTYRGRSDMRYRKIRITTHGQQVLQRGKDIERTLLAHAEGLRTQLLQLLPQLMPQPGVT